MFQQETRLSQIWKLLFGLQSNKAVGFQCRKAIHTWKNKNCSLNSAIQEGEENVPAAILLKTKPTAPSPIKMCASTGDKNIYKYPTLFVLIMKLFHLFDVLTIVIVFLTGVVNLSTYARKDTKCLNNNGCLILLIISIKGGGHIIMACKSSSSHRIAVTMNECISTWQ